MREKRTVAQVSKVAVAGVVVIKDGRFLAIHRPKKGDWSLPKGRLDPGESSAEAAVRECLEETGIQVRLHGALPTVPTSTRDLTYYAASVVREGEFKANKEVDAVAWVPISESESTLTAKLEAVIVRAACAVREHGLVLIHSPRSSKKVRKKVQRLYRQEYETTDVKAALKQAREGRVVSLKVKDSLLNPTVKEVCKALGKGKTLRGKGASVYVIGEGSVSEVF